MKVFSVLLALWVTPFALAQQTQAPGPPAPNPNQIEDIQINGTRVPRNTILNNLRSKVGDTLEPEVIRRDIKTLYERPLGFDDIRVLVQDGPRGGKIVIFEFKDRKTIRRITYKGISSITESDIAERFRDDRVQLTQDTKYDPAKVRKAEGVIKAMLGEKGKQNATIDTIVEDIPPSYVGLVFTIVEGPKIRIEKIDIEGNTVFSDRQLKRAMKLTKEANFLTVFTSKDTFYDLKLADDTTRIRILYSEHGYLTANMLDPIVEVKPTRLYRTFPFIRAPFPWGIPIPFWTKVLDRFYIKLGVEENDQFRVGDVKVTGSKSVDEGYLLAALGLTKGEIFNETQLQNGIKSLKTTYGRLGMINFTAVPEHDLDQTKKVVNITLDIDEGQRYFVNRITFSGNTTTRDKVIRRELMVAESNVFDSHAWDLSLLRLNQLGYFDEIKDADSDVKIHPKDPTVDITLKVTEKARNTIGLSGGVSALGGGFVGVQYSTNNFLGFGENLSVDVSGGTQQSNFQLNFNEPYFMDRPISTGFSIFTTNYRYDQARDSFGLDPRTLPEGLGFENRLNFEQKRQGFTVYGSYPIRLFQRLGLVYQWDNSETTAVNAATADYFQNVTTQEQQNFISSSGSFSTLRTRKLIPNFTWNTVDSPVYPTRGQSISATFDFTGGFLGGNVNYYRPSIEYRFYKPSTKRRNVIAMRLMASHVRGFSGVGVPFSERFFMGGDYDIRGFDFRAITPSSFLTRNLPNTDPETGAPTSRPYDDIVYLGGDTQGVFNLEYRIPIVGRSVTVSPFFDLGNTWVTKKEMLQRQVLDSDGNVQIEGVQLLRGTNSGLHGSTGVEVQIVMPVISAPFRLIFAYNPLRTNSAFVGPATGSTFVIQEPKKTMKFTIGRTF